MASPNDHRRTIRHYDDVGDMHELTFSCYQRMPLLTNDEWRSLLVESIDRAAVNHHFSLSAFVFMPEHVHLLVFPTDPETKVENFLYALKRPYSYRVKQLLISSDSPLLKKLTVWERRKNKSTFRYWAKGAGLRSQPEHSQSGHLVRRLHPPEPRPTWSVRAGCRLALVECPMVCQRRSGRRPTATEAP